MMAPRLRHPQRGVVFYLAVVIMLSALTMIGIGYGRLGQMGDLAKDQAAQSLARARAMMLSEILQPDLRNPGIRPGQLAFFPDLPVAIGGGPDLGEPNLDGQGELAGCATRLWVPGQAVQPVDTAGANARCFGRLPWQTLGLTVTDPVDPAGEIPWVVASPNLFASTACLPNLNPSMLAEPFTAWGCPSALPYPWLRVVDGRGNLLSDRVALALIAPGPPVTGQNRAGASRPSDWMDRLTVAAGCRAPCTPGTYDNAGYTHANNQAWTLVKYEGERFSVAQQRDLQAPVAFNDRLVYITIDEVLEHVQNRARRELMKVIDEYRVAKGYLPFSAPFDEVDGNCQMGLRIGHPPLGAGTCGPGEALALPTWFGAGGWHRYFVLAASSRCVRGSAACNAPGLRLDTNDAINGLLFSPGPPLLNPPYAPALGAAQRPINGGVLSANAADWLDDTENAAGAPDIFVTPVPSATINDRLHVIN